MVFHLIRSDPESSTLVVACNVHCVDWHRMSLETISLDSVLDHFKVPAINYVITSSYATFGLYETSKMRAVRR